jgi:hypothetical protein
MDTLREFLITKNITIKQFCLKNRFNYNTFRQIMCRAYKPSPKMALQIEKATKGKVNRLDLLYPKEEVKSHAK